MHYYSLATSTCLEAALHALEELDEGDKKIQFQKIFDFISEGDKLTFGGNIKAGFKKYSQIADVNIDTELLTQTAKEFQEQGQYDIAAVYLRAMIFNAMRKE